MEVPYRELAKGLRTFGRRRLAPRACIVDPNKHIRLFLVEALGELGFIATDCANAVEFGMLHSSTLDLVVLGISAESFETAEILAMLAQQEYVGRLMIIGPQNSVNVAAVQQLGEELGMRVLSSLATPFSAETLSRCLAMLLPQEPVPSPVVDVAECMKLGWLELWYQNKIDTRTLVQCGAEGLIRIRHPSWGIFSPADYIPDNNDPCFRQLSGFLFDRVLDDWRYFVEHQGPVELSINLPIAVLRDRSVVQELCKKIPTHPAFRRLLIEINSMEAVSNLDLIADADMQLRLHNIAISVDNLGVEWPSLLAHANFPFVELKVDRQFITGCAEDRLKRIVCRGIVDMARDHGLRTVAKGVESRSDFRAVHNMGFDLIQGFVSGKPMRAKEFARAALTRATILSPK
jgi:EAL domain-containing protein (putative c-di-GMP-specific phosphodiesterase class I)/CheY-like chemotaxis protein